MKIWDSRQTNSIITFDCGQGEVLSMGNLFIYYLLMIITLIIYLIITLIIY